MPKSTSLYVTIELGDRVRSIARREQRAVVDVLERMADVYERSYRIPPQLAVCPSCHVPASLRFAGIQEGFEGTPDLTLWNCEACGTTVSGRAFLRPAVEAELLVRYAPEREMEEV